MMKNDGQQNNTFSIADISARKLRGRNLSLISLSLVVVIRLC